MRKFLIFCFLSLFSTAGFAETLINDTETENLLMELVSPLARAADIPESRLKIRIVNSDEFNAFVKGGEEVFVYTGLLTQIKSPAALQAVIAHELGHTLGGHLVQMSARMDAELKRALIIQALGVGLMAAGGNPMAGAGVLAGSAGITQQSMLAFSRDEERMADDLGLDLMIKAELDAHEFIEVFEQMREMTGAAESKANPNRINHPLTAERLKNVKEKISTLRIRNQRSVIPAQAGTEIRNNYEMVRAKLVGYLDSAARVKELYPSSDKSDPAIYARAIANMRVGNLAGAKVGTQTLISRNPKNPYFYELTGDIEYQYGHYDDSVDAYEQSLKLSKNAPQIQTALALVLSERRKTGDIERAIELCKHAILKEPIPLTYWVLARVETPGKSDWAMAEYHNMNGNKKEAKKHAKKARGILPQNSPEYIKSGELL
ncbi:MAG: M48 family metalloprotease [Rickettsiales bacterium]|jgi:predicted Zn-dependent protease|nr:M48 family metalloprotease [Rickettsiales bacterium]